MPEKLNKHVLSWADDVDGATLAQASRTGKMPFVKGYVALMPDAHLGLGSTVGSVIPTEGAIMPAAVGVDIGCGMIAVQTNLLPDDLPDDLGDLLGKVEQSIPAGVGQGHHRATVRINPNETVKGRGLTQKAARQMGSLGSGNHFVEVCIGGDGFVWCVLHSGSRGVGNKLARIHIDKAKGLMKQRFIHLEDPDLAYLVQGEPEFKAYIDDLMWAQDYALQNRETMMDALLADLGSVVAKPLAERWRINCHHNYTEMEHHHGRNMWITRKGAIRAREGDYGVIPGSMGTNSFIVKGLGNPASFQSSAHGAGRRMSRRKAKEMFDVDALTAEMQGKTWLAAKAQSLLDEAPGAYKDINHVMRQQADLVEIVVELDQVLNYKGT